VKNKVFAVATLMFVAGCSTVSQMSATGGSRADGIVRLSYEQGKFQKADIDEATSLQTAQARCRVWGYKDAEAFGGVTRVCNAPGGMYGCNQYLVTKEYQCTGGNTPS